jgi:hypothetical protein
MELPMRKMFEFEQQFWADVFADILGFVIRQGIRFNQALASKGTVKPVGPAGATIWEVEPAEGIDLSVETNFPPIVEKDLSVWSTAIAQVGQTEALTGQALIPAEEKSRILLRAFGYTGDTSEIINTLRKQDFKMTNLPPPVGTPGSGEDTDNIAEETMREAETPNVGKPLSKSEAEKVKPVTKQEVDDAFDAFAAMPSLADMAKKLGMSVEDLDHA